jgi:dienelactone hydrolase
MKTVRAFACALACGFFVAGIAASHAQVTERTIEEIKVEALARANRGAYPMGGLSPKDVEDAFALIKTRDRDEWAAGFGKIADKYLQAAAGATTPQERSANYVKAWRLLYFAQWPTPASEGKKAAYAKAVQAYLKHAQTLDPPVERIVIPFEGKEIVGYLRLPKSATPVPLVFAISGLDSRKETVAETYNQMIAQGVGYFTIDGPGTGEAPLKVSTGAERMFSKALDYLATRPEIDSKRIVVHGVSFGAYWAAKLAVLEKGRIIGAVAQSAPVHDFFSEKFTREGTLGNREYLFDLAPAFISVVDGAANIEDLVRIFPSMSLKTLGLLDKGTAPMLVVAGVKDTQVPMSDTDMLLHTGDVPKDAWINPSGGHLGREARGWTDPVIFQKVIMPWELRLLKASQ